MTRERHLDAVVIGAGTAGLTAGVRLAQEGARVCVLAKGIGSTHLAPGTIDVLGYSPSLVSEPERALEQLIAAQPEHPYAVLGIDAVRRALTWFGELAERGPYPGYGYVGGLELNGRYPSALGALRPSALVPSTMAAGEREALGRVCIAGIRSLRDFHPALCAENLVAAGVDARAAVVDLEVDRADAGALGLARAFDDAGSRARFCARLARALRDEDTVGLPAVLGVRDPETVLADLAQRLGRRVFEIPTLPPSVPGLRLFEILTRALRAAGGRLVLGGEVVAARRSGASVQSVTTASAGSPTTYAAGAFVLATGGFTSGAIELDSRWSVREVVLDLPLRGVPGPGEPRFVPDYHGEQPLARAGIAVDAELRAQGTANVFVAGAALPGAIPWREHSGEGIALASGLRAAELVAAGAGAAEAAA